MIIINFEHECKFCSVLFFKGHQCKEMGEKVILENLCVTENKWVALLKALVSGRVSMSKTII